MLAFAIWPAIARAQDSSASDDGTLAIARGREGVEFYKRGSWSDALERFRQAESLFHSPVFVLYMARSLRNAGRLLESRETFRRLAAERLEPSAPELWKKAQADGRDELTALEANIPSVIIVVKGGTPNVRITLDDRPVASGEVIELDPGSHRLVATDSGRSESTTLSVDATARRQRVAIQLTRSNALPSEGPTQSARPKGKELYVPGLVIAAAGVTAIVAGGVVGVLALNKKADVRDNLPEGCDGTTCPRSNEREIEERIDSARNLGTVADVLLIGGAAVTATGVGLLLFVSRENAPVAAGASHRGAFVRVRF